MTQPQAEMMDLYRASLKSAADLFKTSLENAERLQNQQLVAIRTAIVEQARSASELSSARTLDELLSAQSRARRRPDRARARLLERALPGSWAEPDGRRGADAGADGEGQRDDGASGDGDCGRQGAREKQARA